MNTEIEQKLLKEIEELKRKFSILEGKDTNQIPTYQYSKIRDTELKKLFDIERNLDNGIFNEWLNNQIEIDNSTEIFLKYLIEENKSLIEVYSEEDLKIKFIAPILNKVKFHSFEKKIRDFCIATKPSCRYQRGQCRVTKFSGRHFAYTTRLGAFPFSRFLSFPSFTSLPLT